MKKMDELKDVLCEALEKIAKKGDVNPTDLDNVFKLTESIKNLMKIEDMGMDNGASSARYRGSRSYGDGSYNNSSYSDADSSYRRWEARGSYGDGDTASARRQHYVRGHYSYDGMSEMEEKIQEMMEDDRMPLEDKSVLKRALSIIRK